MNAFRFHESTSRVNALFMQTLLFFHFFTALSFLSLTVGSDLFACGKTSSLTTSDLAQGEHILRILKGQDLTPEHLSLIEQLRSEISDAQKQSEPFDKMATEAFDQKRYDDVVQFSEKEMQFYPVLNYQGVRVRMATTPYTPDEVKHIPGYRPFDFIEDLERDHKYVYFYKIISKTHLCSYQAHGVDTRFGGRDGASERAGKRLLARLSDRGKTFFMSTFPSNYADGSGYAEYFRDEGPKVIRVRIPLEKTISLNLTYGGGEWFLAGSRLSAEHVFVHNGTDFLPIRSINCSHI